MELSFPRMWALVRNDLRILRSDPAFVLIFTIMPLAFMAFTKGAFGASLAVQYPGRGLTGAEEVVEDAAKAAGRARSGGHVQWIHGWQSRLWHLP